MKTITLQYPDEVTLGIALDDMTNLNRLHSQYRPVVVFADADFDGLRQELIKRRIPNGEPEPVEEP